MSEHKEFQVSPVVGSLEEEQESVFNNVTTASYKPKLAGFWIRFWAYTIDLIVIYAVSGILIKPIFRVVDIPISNPPFLLFTPFKITILLLFILYFTLMTKFLQQTVGKMIMGIKVIPQTGAALTWDKIIFREVIGRFISKMLLLPYLFVVFMPEKEALHDLFADTYVVYENVYEKEIYNQQQNQFGSEQLQDEVII